MEKRKTPVDGMPNFTLMNDLLPAVIQDYKSNEVLMVGYLNPIAWDLTLTEGKVHYYSRKKRRIWIKGEQSGHFQIVKQIFMNCDNTCLLIKVKQIKGACDLGYKSCFNKVFEGGNFNTAGKKVFDPIDIYGENYTKEIILGIPSGSLEKMTISMLNLSGYVVERDSNRSYSLKIRNKPEVKLLMARAEELPHYVAQGIIDAAITGMDLIENAEVTVRDVCDLKYNKLGLGSVVIALAIPKEENIDGLKSFEGKQIATAYQTLTQRFFHLNGISTKIIPSIGATEGKVPFVADAVVELVETGKTLKANNLKPILKIYETTAHLIANNESWGYTWKRKRLEEIAERLTEASQKLPRNPKNVLQFA